MDTPVAGPTLFLTLLLTTRSCLFILSVLSMFACKHCPDRFSAISARGLKHHQKRCEAFLIHEGDANQRRKATATSSKIKRAKLKDRRTQMRLNSAAPGAGVSIFMIINKYKWLISLTANGSRFWYCRTLRIATLISVARLNTLTTIVSFTVSPSPSPIYTSRSTKAELSSACSLRGC